jgi:Rieske Fe-S protein
VILADAKVVVTQPKAGEFKAFSSTCTHQSCQLSGFSDDRITCMCHGSSFSISDGSPRGGPATSPLTEVAVEVEGSNVVRA